MLLTPRETAELLRVSISSIYRWQAQGRFPRPVRLSAGCVCWDTATLETWLRERDPAASLDAASVAGRHPRRARGRSTRRPAGAA